MLLPHHQMQPCNLPSEVDTVSASVIEWKENVSRMHLLCMGTATEAEMEGFNCLQGSDSDLQPKGFTSHQENNGRSSTMGGGSHSKIYHEAVVVSR